MSLAARALTEEQMDAADLDIDSYVALLGDLAKVNRLLRSAGPTLAFLGRIAVGQKHLRILDVGFGHGDMLRSISEWGARNDIAVTLIGIDLNPRSEAIARAATPLGMAIDFRTGDYADLAGQDFDVVASSLVTHHMTDAQLIAFVRFMEAEARLGWMVNDLRRSALAHAGFPWLARAMRWHRIVREDGTLSIARGFREADWERLLAEAGGTATLARIARRFAFRLCVERIR